MYIPLPILVVFGLLFVWLLFAANGRNLLPIPDNGSRIFAATSHAAQDAIVAVMEQHGLKQRFRGDTPGVRRAIFWDGTLVTCPEPWVIEKLGGTAGSIGIVVDDPERRANEAAAFLRAKGFEARVVLDAEPELPIAFVVTNALRSTALNFRKHAVKFPMPQPLTPRPARGAA